MKIFLKIFFEREIKEKVCNTVELEDDFCLKEVRLTVPLMSEYFTNIFKIYYQLVFFVQTSAVIFVCNHEVVCSSCRYAMLWTGDRITGD